MSSAARVRITVFSDARYLRLSDGSVGTHDPAVSAYGWHRGVDLPEPARLAARVAPDRADGLPVHGVVVPLPWYEGIGGAIRQGLRLVRTVVSTVRGSEAVVVRLPGIIGVVAAIACRLTRTPYAAEVVGDVGSVLRVAIPGLRGRAAGALADSAIRRAIRGASVVRFVTERTLQTIYPPKPQAAVWSFSDVQLLSETGFGRPQGDERSAAPTVLAIGSQQTSYKGHDLLIRAVAELIRDIGHLKLRLVGTGIEQPALRELAESLDVADAVEFVGHVSDRAAIVEEIRRAWVFAMPSRTEGLPRALIEAMDQGTPCLATRVGGITELLNDRQLVPPDDVRALADGLRRLIQDPAERRELAYENIERAGSFSVAAQRLSQQGWNNSIREMAE